jgi:hypothetical protein
VLDEHARDVADDPGAIEADAFELQHPLGDLGRRRRRALDGDAEVVARQPLHRGHELREVFRRNLDAKDAGELAAEMRHAALEPVAAETCDGLGHVLDEAGTIGSEQGEDDVVHAGPLDRI